MNKHFSENNYFCHTIHYFNNKEYIIPSCKLPRFLFLTNKYNKAQLIDASHLNELKNGLRIVIEKEFSAD